MSLSGRLSGLWASYDSKIKVLQAGWLGLFGVGTTVWVVHQLTFGQRHSYLPEALKLAEKSESIRQICGQDLQVGWLKSGSWQPLKSKFARATLKVHGNLGSCKLCVCAENTEAPLSWMEAYYEEPYLIKADFLRWWRGEAPKVSWEIRSVFGVANGGLLPVQGDPLRDPAYWTEVVRQDHLVKSDASLDRAGLVLVVAAALGLVLGLRTSFRISDKVRAETFAKETLLANRKLMKFYEPHPFSVHADPQSTFEKSYVNAMFMARSQEDPAKFPNLLVRFTATHNDSSWQVVQQSIQLSNQVFRL